MKEKAFSIIFKGTSLKQIKNLWKVRVRLQGYLTTKLFQDNSIQYFRPKFRICSSKMGIKLIITFTCQISCFVNVSPFALFRKDDRTERGLDKDNQPSPDLYMIVTNSVAPAKEMKLCINLFLIKKYFLCPCSFCSPTSKNNIDTFF